MTWVPAIVALIWLIALTVFVTLRRRRQRRLMIDRIRQYGERGRDS